MDGDTTEAARNAQVAFARRLTPSQRLALAIEMSEEARQISIEAEARRHPERMLEEVRQAVVRRTWGSALASHVPFVAARGTREP